MMFTSTVALLMARSRKGLRWRGATSAQAGRSGLAAAGGVSRRARRWSTRARASPSRWRRASRSASSWRTRSSSKALMRWSSAWRKARRSALSLKACSNAGNSEGGFVAFMRRILVRMGCVNPKFRDPIPCHCWCSRGVFDAARLNGKQSDARLAARVLPVLPPQR
ncbi:hypothetical protein THIARS_70851 [Thiomonas delicata]|uniref:Uncharacterized protein n=1 Tax=Thiomonas delicata TaxID=364030 RepID=A0A238D7P1_THIDL|nr:hypothetical protein THIARS_70851 [Thiomonas delicata]